MDETWINPDYAIQQFTLLGTVLLASLVILPVVLGTLIYGFLSLLARRADYTNRE